MESNATDDAADIARLNISLLAIRPGFNAGVLTDSANGWFKTSFVDAWNRFSSNANIRLATIPDACVRVFHDQPKAADELMIEFIEHLRERAQR